MSIKVVTPCCKRSRSITNVARCAVEFRTVTCSKCHTRYSVKLSPIAAPNGKGIAAVHVATWTEVQL